MDASSTSHTTTIGIDVGGTFTDFVVLGPAGMRVHKRPTTPHDPLIAVAEGIAALGLPATTPVIHGTTIVTNAVLQRRGARTALVTTAGFADILIIGRQDRPALYDLRSRPPEPLVTPGLTFEARERVGAAGEAVQALDSAEIERVAQHVAAAQPEAVGICLLFSFLQPAHELALAAALRRLLPQAFISCSCEAAPEFREFERTSTTVVDAFAGPLTASYLGRLGEVAPTALLMQSSGGLVGPAAAAAHPVCLALSGPAGGVAGAVAIAQHTASQVLTLDMGGTSTDVALCQQAVPMMAAGQLAGWPLLLPMVAVHTIGAGGGSIAWADAGGALRVGPQSAGADPGPACYGRGSDPTVTDAHAVLGRLPAEQLLGGTLALDRTLAERALARLGERVGLNVEAAARGVIQVATVAMARALRHVSVEQGHDPRDATLVPFGGAGPLHACALAEALGISHILVPRFPGVLSALGMTLGSPTRDYRRSVLRPVAGLDDAALAGLLAPLLDQARSEAGPAAQLLPALDLRYTGQSFELTVSHTSDLAGTVAAFHAAHQARYGYHRPGRALELVTVRVRAVTASAACVPAYQPSERPAAAAARQVWCDTGWASAAVLQRQALPVGAAVQGPALLLQDDATTLIEPGWQGVVDAAGNLLLHRSA